MIDIHSHILPGLDDGAKDVKESIQILEHIINQGISEIIATPHILPGSYDNNKETIDKAYQLLIQEVESKGLEIKIYKGAELYLVPNLKEKIYKENFTLAGSKYILIEGALQGLPTDLVQMLFELQIAGYKPILAHAERYANIQNNPDIVKDLINRDILIQINAGSLFGEFGQNAAKVAHQLLQEGGVHFIASDVHHIKNRQVMMKEVYGFIADNLDIMIAELLMQENPMKVINNENIDSLYNDYFVMEKQASLFKRIIHKLINIF